MATVGKTPPRIGTEANAFAIERVNVRSGNYGYTTYRLSGWLRGRRIRRNFKSKEEADAEKDLLEIKAADAAGAIRPVNTRLTPTQVAQAEAAFLRLEDKPLFHAVEWFLANYRSPSVEKLLADAVTEFRAAKEPDVSEPVKADYRKILTAPQSRFPGRVVHKIKTNELEEFLSTRGKAKKTWNNGRIYPRRPVVRERARLVS